LKKTLLFLIIGDDDVPKLEIFIKEQERKALQILSEREYRDPRAQAALIIRQELKREGLLNRDNQPNNSVNKDSNG
jgi:hypothetical protein